MHVHHFFFLVLCDFFIRLLIHLYYTRSCLILSSAIMCSVLLRRGAASAPRLSSARAHFTSIVNEIAAKSFDSNAGLYHQVRPSYPVQSVESILAFADIPTCKLVASEAEGSEGSNNRYDILDLAAGSGLFTQVLQKCISDTSTKGNPPVHICAVEPAAGMRTVFSQELPNVPVFDGTSTSLPFPDNSFDLVTIAQAFHWFANEETLTEIHRVLKKEGRGTLALIWNMESSKIEWMKQLRALYEPYDFAVPQYRKGEWEKAFGVSDEKTQNLFEIPLIKKTFQTEMLVTQANMMNRVESKSYITALPKDELKSLRKKMHHILYEQFDRDFHIYNGSKDGELCARHLLDVELVLTKTLSTCSD